jgi:hypothetical protein
VEITITEKHLDKALSKCRELKLKDEGYTPYCLMGEAVRDFTGKEVIGCGHTVVKVIDGYNECWYRLDCRVVQYVNMFDGIIEKGTDETRLRNSLPLTLTIKKD